MYIIIHNIRQKQKHVGNITTTAIIPTQKNILDVICFSVNLKLITFCNTFLLYNIIFEK